MKNALLLLLTGFVAGILLAPRKGSETWQLVRDQLDEWKEGAIDHSEDVEESTLAGIE